VSDRSDQPWETVLERDGHRVSKSPWGPNDEIGRLNWITPESQTAVLSGLSPTRVFDLAVSYFINMPGFFDAADPKYEIWMTHTPRGSIIDALTGMPAEIHETSTYSGDAISMYTHTGTHMDMLNHGAPDSSNQCVTSWPGRCTVGSCAGSFGSVSVQVTSFPELGWLEMNLMIGSS